MRTTLFATISIVLGFLAAFAFGEVACRILPVNDGLMAAPVNETSPIFHFTPNRDLTWSRDWNFSIVNRLHINNAGFVNDQDYVLNDPRPLLAVVGDSFVEAAMVPWRDTLHGRLTAATAPTRRVYSFAASGAPLSQYLIWARDARMRWNAEALVIVVIGNDFDESLMRYKKGPGFWYYTTAADGQLVLRRVDYEPSGLRIIARKSALARYFFFNLQAQEHVGKLAKELLNLVSPARAELFAGNTSATADPERVAWSQAAVRTFVRDLSEFAGWLPEQVLLILDGVRYPQSSPAVMESFFVRMREFLAAEAERAGYEVIDMDPIFFKHFLKTGDRFEYPTDGHWNGLAHGLAADAALRSKVFSSWHNRRADSVQQ